MSSRSEALGDGDRAAVGWTLDLTPEGGERIRRRQGAVQARRNGRIVRESFHDG
jgi:hypothetical protein